jgi:hypothetical protein
MGPKKFASSCNAWPFADDLSHMNELSPEESEALVEAAARGEIVAGHGDVAEVLVGLHAPLAAAAAAPTLATVGGDGVTRRIARRTAVAASVAVLSLAGVAAAATGTLPLGEPADAPEVEIVESDAAVGTAAVSEEAVESGDDGEKADRHEPIEGVDPADGLDDEELEILCDAAVNHGHYVSSVARDKTTEHGGNDGSRVSEAAQSDCGKTDDAEDTEAATDVDEDDLDGDEDDEDDGPGIGSGRALGHDKGDDHPGHGNGHDKD